MLATGRMHVSALPYAQELNLPSHEVILSYNGAMLRRIDGEVMQHIAVNQDLALSVIRYCQQRNWTLNVYYDDGLYVDQIDENVEYYKKMAQVPASSVGDLATFIAEGNKSLSKLLVVGSEQEIDERIDQVKQDFGQMAQVTRSKARYIEITHPKASKGFTLARYAESLGLSADHVLAIGDSGNDITMLQWAGVGVAMGNAGNAVQKVADYVTFTNEEAGVAQALRRFVLH